MPSPEPSVSHAPRATPHTTLTALAAYRSPLSPPHQNAHTRTRSARPSRQKTHADVPRARSWVVHGPRVTASEPSLYTCDVRPRHCIRYLRMQPSNPAPLHFCGTRHSETCCTWPLSAEMRTTTTSMGLLTFALTTGTTDSDTPL